MQESRFIYDIISQRPIEMKIGKRQDLMEDKDTLQDLMEDKDTLQDLKNGKNPRQELKC